MTLIQKGTKAFLIHMYYYILFSVTGLRKI